MKFKAKLSSIGICGNIIKVLFIGFNVVFLLIGLGIIAGGIYLIVTNNSFAFITQSAVSAAAIIIAAGVVTTVLAIFGIIAALAQWRFILILYSVIIVIIILLEIAAGIYGFIEWRNIINGQVRNRFEIALNMFGQGKSDVDAAVNFFQTRFSCCGIDNASDWMKNTSDRMKNTFIDDASDLMKNTSDRMKNTSDWMNNTFYSNISYQLPNSCCKANTPICMLNNSFTEGCFNATIDFISTNIYAIGAVGIAVGIVELIGAVLAMILCVCIHRAIKLE